ncbi:MAG TPA: PadR family transcriptional regulator [Candidatus Saccharimonadales bacterium]|nr:PadR family transcriptional regulator [Candidatus Saccharimonadales bacterium]
MSARLMVLGVMKREGQAHGYKVYSELTSWRAETWSKTRPGSIYHAITQLEKEGFIQKVGSAKIQGPSRTNYRITVAGEQELARLIEKALVDYDLEVFAAGMAFMHELPRGRVIELARQRLKAYEEVSTFLEALPQEKRPTTPAKHPEIIGAWKYFFDGTGTWQQGFIERLENGYYLFDGEDS